MPRCSSSQQRTAAASSGPRTISLKYVVTPFIVYGRPRGSGAEVELAETWAFKVSEGLIVEVREYLTREAALTASPSGRRRPKTPVPRAAAQ